MCQPNSLIFFKTQTHKGITVIIILVCLQGNIPREMGWPVLGHAAGKVQSCCLTLRRPKGPCLKPSAKLLSGN